MQQQEQDTYGPYTAQDKVYPPIEHHLNGWEFLQWLISYIGKGIQWAWDEHPFMSISFALLIVGLILVLTGHLDGTALWKSIVG